MNITVLENEIHILATKQLWQQKQDSAADLCALVLTGTTFQVLEYQNKLIDKHYFHA